jgi:hemerythrin-like domain-containing protein
MAIEDTTPAPAPPPEELNGVLLVHASLRKGGASLQAASARLAETPGDTEALTRLWGFYARGLRHHHGGEDEVIFPLVRSRRPDFADLEADMRHEHEAIDELLDAADAAFDRVRTDGSAAHARQASDVVGQLNDVLEQHLAHEESAALPIIVEAISPSEMEKIEKGLLRKIPRRDLGLSLAALEATAKDHPELHLPPVPKPALVLLSLVWRRQYASLIARAAA